MLHRANRTWTPYVDPHPEKENTLSALPLKTPVRHLAGAGKHHTLNGKASLLGSTKHAPFTGNSKASGSQTVKGTEKVVGEGKQRAPATVFKDRNLVLTGKKNGVSVRGSGQDGTAAEGDTFGTRHIHFQRHVTDLASYGKASRNSSSNPPTRQTSR